MYKYAFAALSAALLASPASAADFNGPRAEIRLGYDRVKVSYDYRDFEESVSGSDSKGKFGAGIEIGADTQPSANFVFGGYFGLDATTNRKCTEVFGLDEACIKFSRNRYAGLRAGFVAADRTLIYVKGGLSQGRVTASYEDFENILDDYSEKDTRGGYHFGVGAEFNIASKGYVKAELVRTNYTGYGYRDEDYSESVDARRDQAMVGFGLRF